MWLKIGSNLNSLNAKNKSTITKLKNNKILKVRLSNFFITDQEL